MQSPLCKSSSLAPVLPLQMSCFASLLAAFSKSLQPRCHSLISRTTGKYSSHVVSSQPSTTPDYSLIFSDRGWLGRVRESSRPSSLRLCAVCPTHLLRSTSCVAGDGDSLPSHPIIHSTGGRAEESSRRPDGREVVAQMMRGFAMGA